MIEVNKIAIPFGRDGNKNTIYDTRQQGQAENDATWSTGFPPITMQDKTDGGLPPKGLDFNGIFYDISSNVVFSCMGGQYQFDAEYAEKIGGYPKGAILMNNALDKQYISNTDKNKIDFNSADSASLTAWSIISIKDIDKLLAGKIDNADFSTALNLKADSSTQIIAGNGITGGGTLQSNRTLTLGTPSKIEETSKNAVTASSHTHEIAKASTSTMGITKLSSVISDAEDVAATPKSVSTAQNRADSAYALADLESTPVGTIQAFVGENAPNAKWLLRRGQAFRAGSYPELAQLLPDLKIPDLRGVALRGLDANRGFDPGRALLSYQEDAMQKITGKFDDVTGGMKNVSTEGAFKITRKSLVDKGTGATSPIHFLNIEFDSSSSPGARTNSQDETVMKNVAVNFIIKAR